MEDLKALFLALIMPESKADASKLLSLGNNEGVNEELVGIYVQQVKANKKYMKLSFQSKLKLVEGAKEELVHFLGVIDADVEGVNANEFLANFG